MNKFVDKMIPNSCIPREVENVELNPAYRATKSLNELGVQDFLPTYIEIPSRAKKWKRLGRGVFGVSLFDNLEDLKEKINYYPELKKKIKSYSKGFCTKSKGICTQQSGKSHACYFLYDYLRNNPYVDFNIIQEEKIK